MSCGKPVYEMTDIVRNWVKELRSFAIRKFDKHSFHYTFS